MTTILPRRGTAAQWTAANPILQMGEMGYETDTKLHKRGDGTTRWNALNYYSTSLQKNIPMGLGSYFSFPSSMSNTFTGTCRVPFIKNGSGPITGLMYANQQTDYNGDANPAGDKVIGGVALEYPSGTIYKLTSSQGQNAATISPNGIVEFGDVSVDIPDGAIFWVRTFISGTWVANRATAANGAGGRTATTDLTAPGSAAIPDINTFALLVGPSFIKGTNTGQRIPTVAVFGDSIANGHGDGILSSSQSGINTVSDKLGGGGFVVRNARTNKYSLTNIAVGGDNEYVFVTQLGHLRRIRWAEGCKTAIEQYGYNDLNTGGRTVAQLQADAITAWYLLNSLGMRVFRTTLIPSTTSTDGWVTLANQTVKALESKRVQFNDWLRDGAPLDAATGLVAVATGTVGARRCNYFNGNTLVTAASGNPHPAYGVAEIADTVESARNSGKFAAPTINRTLTDASITSGGYAITSATGNFTSADLGRLVTFSGAGTAGGLLITTIKDVYNTTTIGIPDPSGTAVASGGVVKIVEALTGDGTHPWPWGAIAMSTGLPNNYFI